MRVVTAEHAEVRVAAVFHRARAEELVGAESESESAESEDDRAGALSELIASSCIRRQCCDSEARQQSAHGQSTDADPDSLVTRCGAANARSRRSRSRRRSISVGSGARAVSTATGSSTKSASFLRRARA